jgi:hypothetical protein
MNSPVNRDDIFYDNYLDACSKLNELEQFRDYVSVFIAEEEQRMRDLHVDVEIGFAPLFAETFPPILHSSIIITTIILIEMELKGYCEALRTVKNLQIGHNDLNGGLLERFRKYVGQVAGIEISAAKLNWDDINGVFEIRNALVHNAGALCNFSKAHIIRSFESRHGTPVCSQERIKITPETSKVTLDVASHFIEGIYDAMGATIRSKYG